MRKFRWTLDFSNRGKLAERLGFTQNSELRAPPGYGNDHAYAEIAVRDNHELLVKRSWDIALDPLKKLPMQAFMVWMIGTQLNLFSIMMVAMMMWQPIQACLGVRKQFERIRGAQCALQRLVFLIGTLLSLALALYKFHSMGLLPTHPSDWLAFTSLPKRVEHNIGGLYIENAAIGGIPLTMSQ